MKTSHLFPISCAAWLIAGACSSPEMQIPGHHYVVVKAEGLPRGASLRFKPRLDGRRAEQMDLQSMPDLAEVRFDLQNMDVGRFTLDAVAVAADGWPAAEGHVDVDVSTDVQTLTTTLTLAPIDQTVCVPTTEGADRWCQVQVAQWDLNTYAIHGSDSDNIWAVGSAYSSSERTYVGSIWHWNGFRWRQERHPSGAATLSAVWTSGYDDAWVVGNNNKASVVWRWNARIQSWETVDDRLNRLGTIPSLNAVWGSGRDDVWAAGGATGPTSDVLPIWHWDGRGWDIMQVNQAASVKDIWGTDKNHIWMVGENDTVLQWDGMTWRRPMGIPENPKTNWYSVWASANQDVWISDYYQHLLRRADGQWKDDGRTGNPKQVRGACRSTGECELWGIKDTQIVRLDTAGWVNVDEGHAEDRLNGLWVLGPSSIWATGAQGRVWEVAPVDSVKRRIDHHSPPGTSIQDLWFDDQKRLWLFGNRAWRWDGWRWQQVGKKPPISFQSVVFNHEKDIWGVGNEGMVTKLMYWTGDDSMPDSWVDQSPQGMKYVGYEPTRFVSDGQKLIYPIMYSDMLNYPGFAVNAAGSWGRKEYIPSVSGNAAKFVASCAGAMQDYDSCIVVGIRDRDNRIWVHDAAAPSPDKWSKATLSVPGLTTDSHVVDMHGVTGTGQIWVAFSDRASDKPRSQLARLQKQGGNWMATTVEDLPVMIPRRLLARSASEVWTVGSQGTVLRWDDGDKGAAGADLSFNAKNRPAGVSQDPTLTAIAVGDRSQREVWVADEANGALWRLVQP